LQATADLLRRRRNEEGGGELSRKSRTTAGCDSHRISQLNFMPAAAKISFAAEHHHQRLMSPRNLSSVGNPLFLRFALSFLKFQLDVSET
jgi:hypothetical protein